MLARPDFNVPPIKQALSSLQVHAQLTVTALTTLLGLFVPLT